MSTGGSAARQAPVPESPATTGPSYRQAFPGARAAPGVQSSVPAPRAGRGGAMNPTPIAETRFPLNPDTTGFPFRRELTLAPLVAAWHHTGPGEPGVKAALLGAVQEAVRKAPELIEPIQDLACITRHRELVEVLMSKVFPASSWERDLGAAMLPFSMQP